MENGLKYLCECVNKKYGIITYSGTLAIEGALRALNIGSKDKVIVSGTICYSIIEVILRLDAIPVIVYPKNGFTLTREEVQEVIDNENDIKCIILAHQFGLAQDIKSIKDIAPNIPMIEDIAQAFKIVNSNELPGLYSDIVITSFGHTKPLSLGYGGALFSNDDFSHLFDFYNNESRSSNNVLMPYTMKISDATIDKICKKANSIVRKQRKISALLSRAFENTNIITYKDSPGSKSVWHRFPIICPNKDEFNRVIALLEKCKVEYQLPHEKELYELGFIKSSSAVIYGKKYLKEYVILIRTRTNEIKNVLRFVKGMKR